MASKSKHNAAPPLTVSMLVLDRHSVRLVAYIHAYGRSYGSDTPSPPPGRRRAPRSSPYTRSSRCRTDRASARTSNLGCPCDQGILVFLEFRPFDPAMSVDCPYLQRRPGLYNLSERRDTKRGTADLLFSLSRHFRLHLCPLSKLSICLGPRHGVKVALADGEKDTAQFGCES